ncbi:A24 family peptidase [Ruminococcus sp.]|uniref:prepilin peptidase n=1 Tax=Ruminococcus sp. TaxID=41978 RepID=UPI0025E96D4E|nr:A24 family peptidase [Ruminococcus sp.]MCI5816668.1 prepilin peptidase [Ruminococcus sp.]MDD7556907.1 prepilin peptidase [Ruminococcus sp.]MDY4963426.1 prepilin peptidase [Ruminococcus callidus]
MLPILTRTIGGEFMDWQFYLLFFPIVFLYGICIGSFLNVLIYRLPNNESLVKRASHCMTCQTKIRKRDLIPVFSWIFLRGKCHSCGAKISAQYPIVEALNGILYIIALLVLDLNANGIISCVFFSLLIVVGFMDWNTLEIDLRVLLAIALLAIPSALLTDTLTISQRLIGAVCVSIPFFLIGEISGAVMKRRTGEKIRGIELGDTLLMAASGLLIGPKAVAVAALIGIFLAAACGLAYKRITGESKFAFGPFLSMGLVIGTLFGNEIVAWYINHLILE